MPSGRAQPIPPGSESRACSHWGFPGTWDTFSFPLQIAGTVESRVNKPPRTAVVDHSGLPIAKNRNGGEVLPNEGNEVRREGREGVGVFRMTNDVGEPSPEGPDGGKETPE